VALGSAATNLVTGDSNGVSDIFITAVSFGPAPDLVAPVVSNIQPTGTIGTSSATVSAYFSDADPSSGIDPASANLTVSGGTVSGCVATESGISCAVTGLADGEHTINVTVADNAGNTGSGSGSFTVYTCQGAKPVLGIATTGAFWGSYPDYLTGLLSVNYNVSNAGPGTAQSVQLIGAVNTMGAETMAGIPGSLGNIAVGSSEAAVVKYHVPAGVSMFRSSIYAAATDACGVSYAYPGPMPGA
jgi:hypothetical protein